MKNQIVKLNEDEKFILDGLTNIVQNAAAVAERVRQLIAKDPEWVDNFCERAPGFTPSFLRRISLLGVKESPQLLFTSSAGAAALRRLPLDIQEKHATEPVELLLANMETLCIDIHNLSPLQASQVFASDHVRSLAEQRAWLEDQATRKSVARVVKPDMPYRVVKTDLVIMEPCKLSRKQLMQLLSEMD